MVNNKYLASIALAVSFAVFIFMDQGRSSLAQQLGTAGTVATDATVPTTDPTAAGADPAANIPQSSTPVSPAPAPVTTSKKTTTKVVATPVRHSGDDDSDNPVVQTPAYTTYTPPITTTVQPTPAPVAPVAAPTPAPTPAPTTPVAQAGQYKNGTYTGSAADAYYGTVQVQAIISGGRLANIQILSYPSDRGTSVRINQQAMPRLVSEAIQTQSANVNTVSGASDSSAAFRQSLGDALSQAVNS